MPDAVKAVPPAGKTGKSDPELRLLPGWLGLCVTKEANGDPVPLCKMLCGVAPQLEFRPTECI